MQFRFIVLLAEYFKETRRYKPRHAIKHLSFRIEFHLQASHSSFLFVFSIPLTAHGLDFSVHIIRKSHNACFTLGRIEL
jgi:hypothetical protein